MIEQGLLYTKEHEWIKIEGKTAVMGISFHAQELLGDVTFVELPEKGAAFDKGQQIAVVESSKAASDVYCPVGGTVLEVNDALDGAPEQINQSCYKDGWLCKLQIKDPKEAETLMDAAQYEKFLAEQE